MDLHLKLKTKPCECAVFIKDESHYIPEESTGIAKDNFKFSETISIDVLVHHTLEEDKYISAIITDHSEANISLVPIDFDGWFTIHHIVIPSAQWVSNYQGHPLLKLYNTIYFSNGLNIYKLIDGEIYESNIIELLETTEKNTTIQKLSKEYVSICFLKKCYLDLCNLILGLHMNTKCASSTSVDSELTYKRDIAWMALNVIKYLTDCPGQLAEVERIIELLQGCNGICPKTMASNSGCGCGGQQKSKTVQVLINKNVESGTCPQAVPFTEEEIIKLFGNPTQATASRPAKAIATTHTPFTEDELRDIFG